MKAPSGRSVVISESWKRNSFSSLGWAYRMRSDIIEMQTKAYPNTNDPKATITDTRYKKSLFFTAIFRYYKLVSNHRLLSSLMKL